MEDYNFFMTCIYPSEMSKIKEYNRVLKSLNNLTKQEFLNKMSKAFEVSEPMDNAPISKKHQISLLLDNRWYRCEVKSSVLAKCMASPTAEIDSLDVQILNDYVFRDILGIDDVRYDDRIDFVAGNRGMNGLLNRCADDSVAAFALHPIELSDWI